MKDELVFAEPMGNDEVVEMMQEQDVEEDAATSLSLSSDWNKRKGTFCIKHVSSGTYLWTSKRGYAVFVDKKEGYDYFPWYYLPSNEKLGYGFIQADTDKKHQLDNYYHKSVPLENTAITWADKDSANRFQYPNLFRFNQYTKRIQHVNGLYLSPQNQDPNSKNMDYASLEKDLGNDSQGFLAVNCYTDRPFEFDEARIIGGHWEMIFSVLNPVAQQTQKYTTEIGISSRDQTMKSLGGSAEIGGSFYGLFSAKYKISGEYSSISRKTFSKKESKEMAITVRPGKPVVVWQYVIDGEFAKRSIDFNSEIYYHTKSVTQKPPNNILRGLKE